MNTKTKYQCMLNSCSLIPFKIYYSGPKFHLVAVKTEDIEANSRDETNITYG